MSIENPPDKPLQILADNIRITLRSKHSNQIILARLITRDPNSIVAKDTGRRPETPGTLFPSQVFVDFFGGWGP